MFRRFQTTLVLFFLALFAVVQVITLVAVYQVTMRNVHVQIKDQLRSANRIFHLQVDDRMRKHAQAARVLAADFGFRAAVTSSDPATVQSAIRNLGARAHADRVLLVSLDNRRVTDTGRRQASTGRFPFGELTAAADEHDDATAMIMLDGILYEMVVVPVLAPQPVAWLVIGTRMDDGTARALKTLLPVNLDVSFAFRDGGGWRVAATTGVHEQRATVGEFLERSRAMTDEPRAATLGNERYMMLVSAFKTPENAAPAAAILQYSIAAAVRPYQSQLLWLLVLTGAGFVALVIGGMFIARNVTRPVRELADAAMRLEKGDYAGEVDITRRDELGQLAVAFRHMTAGIAEREDRILHQARHDAVTQLPNRLFFEQRVREAIAALPSESAGCTVVLVYIDRFADIRNTLGHAVSDRLIFHVGERLRHVVKSGDTLARLATDEFVLLTAGVRDDDVPAVAERLLAVFDSSFVVEGVTIDVGAHVGVASYPAHGADADTLLKHADVAMSVARGAARRFAVYDPGSDRYTRDRLSLMSELRDGLERGDVRLHYQPLVDIATGQVSRVEALVRWQHPRAGPLPPDEFIPLAEKTGHIERFTAWCLEQAIAQCSAWREAGLSLGVAVNLSARDLPNRRLPSLIGDLLDRYRAHARWLTLEITEGAIMHDPEQALHVLRALKDMGLRLAIDDFGTGYSSMTYLKRLPIDELKIDKSFVLGLAGTAEDEIIVRAIVELGHNLDLRVVAEGVEDEAALDILRRYGCDRAQGFLFSHALAAPALERWLAIANRQGALAAGRGNDQARRQAG